MAILNGREVTFLGFVEGPDVSRQVRILEKDGSTSFAKLNQLKFTKEEKADLQKIDEDLYQVIDDKDLKELRDSQDKNKIEKKQESKTFK